MGPNKPIEQFGPNPRFQIFKQGLMLVTPIQVDSIRVTWF